MAQGGAALLGLPASRLETGDPADFVLVAAGSLPEAVVDRPIPSMVVRAGRVIARAGRLIRGVRGGVCASGAPGPHRMAGSVSRGRARDR
ncbi:hypothetical protein [Streptomyces sp. NPDC006510]|uniref:hypothetical protein n=1 Tax=Streptomyces sp. NPDC006510 TaxID=3155600 RepID=UPI0033A5DAF6